MKLIVTTLILLMLALSVCQAAPSTYIATKYNVPASSVMADMNDSGLIVGVESTGYSRAFKIENGVKTLLQMPSQYIYSKATAVGNSGIIVGSAYVSASTYACSPCYWDTDGNVHLLPDYGYGGTAQSINSQNKIAGLISLAGYPGWATTWTDFTQRNTNTMNYEFDNIMINDQGMIVVTRGRSARAYYWSDAENRFVPLGGAGGYDSTYARKINNRGQILGGLDVSIWPESPKVVWTDYNNPRILQKPSINGRIRPVDALDINDSGLVVGTAPALDWYTGPVACIWDDLGVYQVDNLVTGVFDGQNKLTGVSFTEAFLIDNNNRILCKGKYNNQYSYYMLTPVPEPSSILTLLCGLGGVGGMVWRRKR